MTKAFESVFGGVTCLPGCFCMYRIKARKLRGGLTVGQGGGGGKGNRVNLTPLVMVTPTGIGMESPKIGEIDDAGDMKQEEDLDEWIPIVANPEIVQMYSKVTILCPYYNINLSYTALV